jgi:hypothetical protein
VDADLAAELRALIRRVRYNIPHRHDPERFHLEKSEIERCLLTLANRLDGSTSASRRKARSRVIVTTEVIGGRRVMVQKTRQPFAIFVGGSQ